jgi:mono/diheme cytochrome c family protein
MIALMRAATAVLVAGVVALLVSVTASAGTYQHARALGTRCSTCHDSKKPHLANLNEAGKYFLARRTLDGYKPAAALPKPSTTPRPAPAKPAGSAAAGRAVYTRSCAVCHGPQGRGTALAAALTGPRKHATTEAAAVQVIKTGIKGTAMVSFAAALTDQEIRDVARYVMTLRSSPSGK